jgi:branched-chain amino acid transport system substrate-binding protein
MKWKILLPLFIILLATSSASAQNVKTIKIGVLCDLSSSLSTYGHDIKDALTIAQSTINNYFKSHNESYAVSFDFEDTQVNPTIALQKVQMLNSKGIKLIIGPMGSGEVSNIRSYVTANKIIIISPSSTAVPRLIGCTKPSDKKYIFRFVATDDFQTKAIAKELQSAGIKGVVILYIGNSWGEGLYQCIKPRLKNESIEIKDVISYDQNTADFSPYIQKMTNDIQDLVNKYGNEHVAVITFSYEEVANLLSQIPSNSILFKVVWFGCDGCAESSQVIKAAADKPVIKDVGLYSTLFEARGPAFKKLVEEYRKMGYNHTPQQYALDAYDAAWVLALSYVQVMKMNNGTYNATLMADIIPQVTLNYSKGVYGVEPVTGFIQLNEWNDRASGNYGIYYVTKNDTWKMAGKWYYNNNTVVWFHKPKPPVIIKPTHAKKSPGLEAFVAIVAVVVTAMFRRKYR